MEQQGLHLVATRSNLYVTLPAMLSLVDLRICNFRAGSVSDTGPEPGLAQTCSVTHSDPVVFDLVCIADLHWQFTIVL